MNKKAFPVTFVSSYTLEPWDASTPWTTGIGGSETSHIEMSQRLHKKGFNCVSYAPLKDHAIRRDNAGQEWRSIDFFNDSTEWDDGIYIFYRNPEKLDKVKGPKEKWYFVAQDVAYQDLTEERLAKIDRYICLCQAHARDTMKRYPSIKERVYVSSNGIRSAYIKKKFKKFKGQRNPNRMLYASSPDRGLKLLLEQWWRIREVNPQAELAVAYGFENCEAIVKLMGGNDWRVGFQQQMEGLLKQDGIIWLGRINQDQLYEEWFKAGIWCHGTDFAETSCITCMDAQACGAFPVTNNLWAIGENVSHGWMVDGIPQKNELVRTQWLNGLYTMFKYLDEWQEDSALCRGEMMKWALKKYDWDNVRDQWARWIESDFKELSK